ncbi:MAG: hypothetical protein KIT84_19500 [Labilithrix sp.]|nr:hypothetical protein [Labilithrix sp.]MCW5813222.1 hypothetical protein [Labilithrix sp.]
MRSLRAWFTSLSVVAACSTQDPTQPSEGTARDADPIAPSAPSAPGAPPPGTSPSPPPPPPPPGDAGSATDASDASPPVSCSPPAPAEPRDGDVVVRVDASRGPKGHAAPVAIERLFYGMSIADWMKSDYAPSPRAPFLALLGALRPGVLRWPAGHHSQEYVWPRGGGGQTGHLTLQPADFDAFVALARAVGAEPLIGINIKRGTAAAAADLLRYLNVEKGYGVRWLQLGNEPDLTDGVVPDPATAARQIVEYADALRAVDPAVKLVGPELLTGAHVNGHRGTVDWMGPILAGTGGRIDGVSWHYYPLDSGQKDPASSARISIPHLFQETAPDWHPAGLGYVDEVMPALDSLRARHAPNAKVWITEIAEDPGPAAGAEISDTVAAGLWYADALGRYAEYGPQAVLRWIFHSVSSHKCALVANPGDAPRPTYGTFWMYSRYFGERFVGAETSSITAVAAHAALRSDGAMTVALINKTPQPRRVRVEAAGFTPCSGDALTLAGGGLEGTSFTINGATLDAASADAEIAGAPLSPGELAAIEVPAASFRLVTYRP